MTDAELKIEKGIPLPLSKREGIYRQYTFGKFEVGDSAFFDVNGKGGEMLRQGLSQFARRNDRKFATRTVTENGVKGLRVWRIA